MIITHVANGNRLRVAPARTAFVRRNLRLSSIAFSCVPEPGQLLILDSQLYLSKRDENDRSWIVFVSRKGGTEHYECAKQTTPHISPGKTQKDLLGPF